MRVQSTLRKLIPASIVALVLAFSYFAPALGLVGPPVQSGFGVNCGRFGYGYHGGKHLFGCPNRPFPSPAIQPLGGLPPKPLSPPRASAPPPPTAQPLRRPVVPPVVRQAKPLSSAPPQALGQVRQTGAFSRLAAESPLVAAIALIVVALVSFAAAIALRWRRRRQT